MSRQHALTSEQIAEATHLRGADPERWTYRTLAKRYGVAWSTMRRAIEPAAKEREQKRPRLIAEAALDRLLAAARAEERERAARIAERGHCTSSGCDYATGWHSNLCPRGIAEAIRKESPDDT